MSTVVLARKYRPKRFAEMVGQDHVVRALGNALANNRLHHAYLFTGTRGVGKTTVSRILAKSLNCTGPDGSGGITAEPCGVCDACREIDAGRYVDYIELDAASNRSVEEMTQLLDQAMYRPVAGRFKVYMIDEVHMLSGHAFNAMLKTLEEPPEHVKFVLATTDPHKVPVTVLSRCLQFNLRPMAPETISDYLQQVLPSEGIAADIGALRLIARGARGSMRDALSLTDQAIAFGAGTLSEAGVREMLGAVGRAPVLALVEALAAGDGAALIAQVDALRDQGLSADGALEELANVAQQMAIEQAVPGALGAAGDDELQAVAALAQALPPDETQLLYSLAIHGRPELSLAPDEYAGLTMVLLRALAFRPGARAQNAPAAPRAAVPQAALKAPAPPSIAVQPAPPPVVRSSRPPEAAAPVAAAKPRSPAPWEDEPAYLRADDEQAVAEAVVREPAPVVPAGVAAEPVAATPEADRWTALMQQLIERGAVSALTRELGWQAHCTAYDEARGRIVLVVERETLRQSAHVDKLQAAVRAALGREITLAVEAGTALDTPARRDAAARAQRQRDAEATIQNDPLVQQLMQQFQTARIVPGSIQPR
ncbi:DNA polymerase III subunit gamma/tau [Caldimonas sp. KR1-144]|uniref:DNA polymerase III subunit gamma/tau n=1 Tax=Caldimonas sp. KR1-144 TaxID=3400911 RepID=UPI003C012CAB